MAKSAPQSDNTIIDFENDRLVGTTAAATVLGLSPKTLRQLRCDREGPRCVKVGRSQQSRVYYRRSDLEAWAASRAHAVGPR